MKQNNDSSYKISNRDFNFFEVTGYLSFVAAFFVLVSHNKYGFEETWLGWAFLIVGSILTIIGILKAKNTSNV